ncbi:MAG: hypothetical protein F6K19_01825 [Cyanothece sp. SIO1E1]|nr:hypothetical protein [Cyanothece sp. SIO1E1]
MQHLNAQFKERVAEVTQSNQHLQKQISEYQHNEQKLAQQAHQLASSNVELEQFAYVASHDLQEPLRVVNSYTQLLAERYQDQLDAKADKYIGYIVDSNNRMRQLIQRLLDYSRVDSQGHKHEPTSCEYIFNQVCANLQIVIQETGALITHTPLPVVTADASQLIQLFQNLIGNAIKFRGEEPPQVHISAEPREQEWVFSVRDHGIGIEPEYVEQIFLIFQRLHTRRKYSGTGIGLAICKKIIERHGGWIWVESVVGEGSTFYFTLPR